MTRQDSPTVTPTADRLPHRLADESGTMIVEMIVAMSFLVIAVGALMTLYASNVVSLRHVSIEGTALTLVDRQMESYKTLPFGEIAIDAGTIPSSSSDPYRTANSADATIPPASGQVTGASVSASTCAAPTKAEPACAVTSWTGPDARSYRVDSYVVSVTPAGGGRAVKRVTVIARQVEAGVVGTKVWSRATSVIDQANPPLTT